MNVGNMAEALKARDEGMASSANHAERDAPGWGERAYQAVCNDRWLLSVWTTGFTMDEARSVVYGNGLDKPSEERAWGSVTRRLVRNGVLEPIGFARSPSSHFAPKPTYRLVRAG